MKVVTVGSAMIDTIAVIASDRIEQMTMRNADTSFLLLEEGRKTDALEISTHCGGGAVNTAVAFSRLGHDAATIVKLGRDTRAEEILSRLEMERVSARWITRSDTLPTGASVLVASHDRNAAIFTYRGANTALSPSDLAEAAFNVDAVHVASLSNKSADNFPDIIAKARKAGAKISANPGIRQLSAKGGALLDCLQSIDLLIMNRVEAEALVAPLIGRYGGERLDLEPPFPASELPAQAQRTLSGGGFEVSTTAFLRTLCDIGPRNIALTLGRHGALLQGADDLIYCDAIPQANPAGSAGAGDAFSATLFSFLATGQDRERAIRAATINAGSVVTHVDTQSGLLDAEKLAQRLGEDASRPIVRRWSMRP